jgi:undecaprenyl-diphosphatase
MGSLPEALLLGLLEGLTEFIPVSSTGHLILLGELLGFKGDAAVTFDIAIQLGAILAVCVVYFQRLSGVLLRLPSDPGARRFVTALALAFLPAVLVGLVVYKYVRQLFGQPEMICVALILGGIAILLIDRKRPATVGGQAAPAKFTAVEQFTPGLALRIGLFQCVAMFPGVSRSGATILGSLLMGVERKTAAEFSFFLAIPTMFAATAYDLYKNRAVLTLDHAGMIAVGFAAAFVSALLVVRAVVGFVGRHGFAPFGWYRIVFGSAMLAYLLAR